MGNFAQHPEPIPHKVPYDKYFEHPDHQLQDYDLPGPSKLPGPDFNKHVYEFDEMKQIWHQHNYNERVKIEADIMVTLEALKTSVRYMSEDLTDIHQFLGEQYLGIKAFELENIMNETETEMHLVLDLMAAAQLKCRHCS